MSTHHIRVSTLYAILYGISGTYIYYTTINTRVEAKFALERSELSTRVLEWENKEKALTKIYTNKSHSHVFLHTSVSIILQAGASEYLRKRCALLSESVDADNGEFLRQILLAN